MKITDYKTQVINEISYINSCKNFHKFINDLCCINRTTFDFGLLCSQNISGNFIGPCFRFRCFNDSRYSRRYSFPNQGTFPQNRILMLRQLLAITWKYWLYNKLNFINFYYDCRNRARKPIPNPAFNGFRNLSIGISIWTAMKKLLILWLFFMPPKLARTRNGFEKMQEYHLRLSFLLSKAELWIQTLNTDKRDAKPDKLLLRCSKIKYICSIYSIGKKTIFISNKITTLKSSAWTVEPQIPEVFLIAAIFQFLLYFLGLTPILLWFVLGLISKMIRRREENEIKRRFSIDGRKFGFSLFSALKRLCILSHVIWAIWYQSFLKPLWHNINIIYFYL